MAGLSDEPASHHACEVCGETFASKNKLFKHLKGGGECAKQSGHGRPAHLMPQEPTSEELERTYIYVIGGRERGHTLGMFLSA